MIYIFKKELYTFKARKVVGYRKTPFTWSRVTTTTAPLPTPPPKKYDLLSVPIYLMYR